MNGKNLLGTVSPLYQRILSIFPQDISVCFAYGSAIYPQNQTSAKDTLKKNVVDLVFVVPNAFLWHEENLKLNPRHYSSLRYLGHRTLTRIQESYGAGVYYNTLIPFEDIQFKYGVVSESSLISDLLDWNYLYLAGRLHKPVHTVKNVCNPKLVNAIQLNLFSAVHAALLLLPEAFSEVDFYHAIAGLSYNGDFRMIIGEDKNKVHNIVDSQLDLFRQIYSPFIKALKDYVEITKVNDNYIGVQDPSPEAKIFHLNQLPRSPQRSIVRHWNKTSKRKLDAEDVLATIAFDVNVSYIVAEALQDIVWRSSVTQSLKGIFTAGISKSLRYSIAKLRKMMLSIKM